MKREEVKAVAIAMVAEASLINLSRRELCKRAGIPDGSFPHVMGCNFSDFVEELSNEGIEGVATAVSKTRVNPTLRKSYILQAAVALSIRNGYNKITREGVASKAKVSTGLVSRYFGTMDQLKMAVMQHAIDKSIAVIIAQGLGCSDCIARSAPVELKAKAAKLLANF